MNPLHAETTLRQRRAADAVRSVWVQASAGAGKTKVLTDRVLSLLLAGARPSRILCLTFTKAAAAEMANRIARRLMDWAIVDEAGLEAGLAELTGRPADSAERVRARGLFAAVIDAEGGLPIQTIHAFCQSVLRRFPLEAGLAPHFQVMDDRDAGELLTAAQEEVLAAARLGGGRLGEALALITARIHESHFPELMTALIGERARLKRLFERHGSLSGAIDGLYRDLGLSPGESPAMIRQAAAGEAAFDGKSLRLAAAALLKAGGKDAERGRQMADWLAAPDASETGFEGWCRLTLTKDGAIRQALCSKAAEAANPGLSLVLLREAERLVGVQERLKSARIAQSSAALLTLGEAFLAAYGRRKTVRAVLDYDDLIAHVVSLLQQDGGANWVLYKLDGGIDHVLIDEAQDTNPEQWAVIRAITGEFFAGRGRRPEGMRTVFGVGDPKQSIYGFQRADPREFEEMRRHLAGAVPAAGGTFETVMLQMSFRSAPAVLTAVDAVFGRPAAGDGVVPPGQEMTHLPFRDKAGGLVELWPALEPAAGAPPEPWKPPVERLRVPSPRTRLARLMAARIAAMVAGERLDSKGRTIRPGDIMVLVRRRGPFVEDLVRALKGAGVMVAGADRMVLAEQIAVMDLMALANVLLLPEDDLTLAIVLKSPLLGLSEEDLFALAWRREGSLWQALQARSGTPPFREACRSIAEWMNLADRLPVHDLFAHILNRGGKARLLARLGSEAEDPLDEFMALTLAYERLHPPSLQGFLRWMEKGGVEIKRDLDQDGPDAVRIMTVHGAKGLQAPIVFLPDTLQAPAKPPRLLRLTEDGPPLFVSRLADLDAATAAARAAADLERDREYRRLLYVAMTRAEDRLYVCGWAGKKAAPDGCWYNLLRDGLAPIAEALDDPFLARAGEPEGARVLRLSNRQAEAPPPVFEPQAAGRFAPLPDWAGKAAPVEPRPLPALSPSRGLEDEGPPIVSPCGAEGVRRFRRGRLIHRLLQSLPDLEPKSRPAAAARFLSRQKPALAYAEQAEIAAATAAILDDPAFAALFAPGSRAEVPVVGRLGERMVAGQVDRLAVTEREVLVVDFKTNRRPPADPADLPPAMLRQMAAYRALLACLYPGRIVRCALLWTDGPSLMPLDPARLDDALAGFGAFGVFGSPP